MGQTPLRILKITTNLPTKKEGSQRVDGQTDGLAEGPWVAGEDA